MTDLQFLQLLKRAFFEFFFIRKNGKRPSLLNLHELVEMYRKYIEQETIKNYKKSNEGYHKNRP